jgi:hypothetical protein
VVESVQTRRKVLPERTHGLSDWTWPFPQREGNPGAGAGMETDEEVSLNATNPRSEYPWAGT